MIHTSSWIAWLLSALIAISLTRNPFYLVLIWFCLAILSLTLRRQTDTPGAFISPIKFSLVIVSLSALLNLVMSRYGETALFVLPGQIPVIGGAYTLEALAYGALNGLVLAGLFTSFTIINQALPVQALIRLIPRAFYPVAVITSIAITFVPATLRQFTQIREAQAVRGHRLHSLRDWLPLFLPLLVGGLERAMALAEAMTARGFIHGTMNDPQEYLATFVNRLVLMASLGVIIIGWLVRLLLHHNAVSEGLIAAGCVGIILAMWRSGQQTKRTIYYQEHWHWQNLWVWAGAILVILNFTLPIASLAQVNRLYNPYPVVQPPTFNAVGGLLILTLLTPAILIKRSATAVENTNPQLDKQYD